MKILKFYLPSLISLFLLLILGSAVSKKCKGKGGQGIIGGEKATKGQFPWMVWLHNMEKGTQCGASVISKNHLLTAAHCVLNKQNNGFADVRNLAAYAGIININDRFEKDAQQNGVKLILHHKNYLMEYHIYEMVILKLTKNFTFNELVKPIRTANDNDTTNFVGEEVVASGWGTTDVYGPDGTASADLLYATLVGTNCTQLYEQVFEDVFCARGRKGENVCSGDSGGPIVCKDKASKDYLCGFSSKSNCDKGYGILGRVNYYTEFIRQALKV